MTPTIEEIKAEIINLTPEDFLLKYIYCEDNWYFRNILRISSEDIVAFGNKFKAIVGDNFELTTDHIKMVGSGKTGFSLAPREGKLYQEFCDDESIRKISDIDVAIISRNLFNKYWDLLRKSFRAKFKYRYPQIQTAIYRGYISEKDLVAIDGCRKDWKDMANNSKNELYSTLYIRHEITYRIYRRLEDFHDYHISSIKKIKKGNIYATTI